MSPKVKKYAPYAGAGIVLIIAALVAYAVAVGPSKAPYQDALRQFKNVYNANVSFSKIGQTLGTTTATSEQFQANIKNAETALQALQSETEGLGKKTVMQEGEGKQHYDAFYAKLQDYAAYNKAILTSISTVRPVIYICSQTASTITEDPSSANALRTCAQNLDGLETVPDKDYDALVTSFAASYAKLATNLEASIALKDPKGADKATQSTLEDERSAILEDLSTASSDLSKNLQTHRAEVDITDTAKALDDYLSRKSRLFF